MALKREQGQLNTSASTPRFGETRCAGRSVEGNQIVYQSQAGFHGEDHVAWDVVYQGVTKARTDVTIKVR